MSGKVELDLKSNLEKFKSELDDIIQKVGISYVKDEESISILSISSDELRLLSSEDCCIYSYKIQQYGLYVQSIYNRLNNIKNWADNYLLKMVGKYGNNYGDKYTKYEEKKFLLVADNTVANELMKISLKSYAKCSELYSVSQKIYNMSITLTELSKSKRNYNNG